MTTGAYVGGAVAPQQSAVVPASVGFAPVVSAPMPVAPRVAGGAHSLAEELEKLKQVALATCCRRGSPCMHC